MKIEFGSSLLSLALDQKIQIILIIRRTHDSLRGGLTSQEEKVFLLPVGCITVYLDRFDMGIDGMVEIKFTHIQTFRGIYCTYDFMVGSNLCRTPECTTLKRLKPVGGPRTVIEITRTCISKLQ